MTSTRVPTEILCVLPVDAPSSHEDLVLSLPIQLSVMHLRLLQEARERIKSKTMPSGPSSSSNQSSQFGDTSAALRWINC
ncbi:hypothetical protein ZWY2020_050560 [Hordeum vulgare]|nr:hypothetical protein ZWY2020_050560 [Hordeum vulgare]